MKSRKVTVAEFSRLDQEIKDAEKHLEKLHARKKEVWSIMTSPLVAVVESYLKEVLLKGKSLQSEHPGQYMLHNGGGWDWDGFIVISDGEYTFVNDYYGDCEVVRFADHLFLDPNDGRVMVSVHKRYCDTSFEDDEKNYSFADCACKVCSSGDMLMVEILRVLNRDKEDFGIDDGEEDPDIVAVFLTGPQRFSLGALEADDRYDEIGNLTFRKGAVKIKADEFAGCDEVQVVRIPEGVTEIGDGAFRGCSRLECIELPESLARIGNGAFKECRHLQKIVFPKGLVCIGEHAFDGCRSLKCINLPDSLVSIGKKAFKDVAPIYISHGVLRIKPKDLGIDTDETRLFDRTDPSYGNLGFNLLPIKEPVTYFRIPDGIRTIQRWAFMPLAGGAGDKFTGTVDFPNSVEQIEPQAFYGCKLAQICIPDSITYIDYDAFNACERLYSIEVDANNPIYDSRNGCNAIIETEADRLILGCMNTIIPDGIKEIDDSAFVLCKGLKSIHLPNSLIRIGSCAFCECVNLSKIHIPDSVVSIESSAFECCDALDDVSVPEGIDLEDSCLNFAERITVRKRTQ